MNYHTFFTSPLGLLLLTSNGAALTGLYFQKEGKENYGLNEDSVETADLPIFEQTTEQLRLYFSGRLKQFDIPLMMKGSDFQRKVWEALKQIEFGSTESYGELARRIGNPAASRAVGLANGKNPISIIVPCHRVIGANGTLTGYGGGIDNKRFLLELEGASDNKPVAAVQLQHSLARPQQT